MADSHQSASAPYENVLYDPDTRPVPVHTVPLQRLVSIEHPCIIRNLRNGIQSLGNEAQIKNVIENRIGDSKAGKASKLQEPVVGVALRPHDPFAKRIPSSGVETHNVVLRVTLPKRTGRKRKRGSDAPFEDNESASAQRPPPTAAELLSRLQDARGKYEVEPIGMLLETHRFRVLPDFQLRHSEIPIMQELRKHAISDDYQKLKDFNIDLSPGPESVMAFPGPPSFTSIDFPYKYDYQQAAQVVFVTDEKGELRTKNMSAARGRQILSIAPDAIEVPAGPPPELYQQNGPSEVVVRAIGYLNKLLDERPLITKRVALNAMPPVSDTVFKQATQWVGYSFKAGPWRDSLIKYGVDPRTDPKYRIYQTLMFQLDKEFSKSSTTNSTHSQNANDSHIFNGQTISPGGKTWQVCDITDPILKGILDTTHLRSKCDVYQWGWFHSGTLAKVRTIMRDKIRFLAAGDPPPEDEYAVIASFPDKMTKSNRHLAQVGARSSEQQHLRSLAVEVRSMVKIGSTWRLNRLNKSGSRVVDSESDADGDAGEEVDQDDTAMPDVSAMDDANAEGEAEGDFDDKDEN